MPLARRRLLLSLAVALLLLALAPFATALEVHHELAAADHDGHQHSDFDLCHWVQLHSTGSLFTVVVEPGRFALPERHDPPLPRFLSSITLGSSKPSRAPPVS